MAKAKKLPSGSWRCLVYSHSVPILDKDKKPILDSKGNPKAKRVYESFTSDDPSPAGRKEAEWAAAQFAMSRDKIKATPKIMKTFGEALDHYIRIKEPVLSPRTIMDYKRIRKNDIQGIMDVKIWC